MRRFDTVRLAGERFLFFGGLIAAWSVASRALGATAVPPPTDVVVELGALVRTEMLWADVLLSMQQVLLALLVATILGVGVGLLGWRFTLFRSGIFPWLAVLNTVPNVLLYPVAIVIFGLGTASIVVLSILLGGMVMAESTYAGFRSVERVHLDVAACYRASRLDVFRKVLVPGAMEVIAAGLRVGFTLVFVVVIATGYILSGGGLGYRLRFFYESFEMSKLYALIIVVIVLSLLCQFAMLGLLRLLRRSSQTTAREGRASGRFSRVELPEQIGSR